MILYVNDNNGVLFLKKIVVDVDPTPPQPRPAGGSAGGGAMFFPQGYSFEESLQVQSDSRRARQEEEELLLMRIFTQVCPNI